MTISHLCLAGVICIIAALAQIACCERVLVYTQERIALDQATTMAIEDASSQSGTVWVKIYDGDSIIQSKIVRIGENFRYNCTGNGLVANGTCMDFTPLEIYAGGSSDLVALEFNGTISQSIRENASTNQTQRPSEEKKAPGMGPTEAVLALVTASAYLAFKFKM